MSSCAPVLLLPMLVLVLLPAPVADCAPALAAPHSANRLHACPAQVKPPTGQMFLVMRRWQQCSDLHSDLFEINGKLQQAGDRQLKCANTTLSSPIHPFPNRGPELRPLVGRAVQADQVRGRVPVQVEASRLRSKGTAEAAGTHRPPFSSPCMT